ncbi:hypothetical protein CLOL250_00020 [Clostridium sp. L2-50]|nr:hypothetical protein CLOL250_00020 [Clostridium sp. L2-50]
MEVYETVSVFQTFVCGFFYFIGKKLVRITDFIQQIYALAADFVS